MCPVNVPPETGVVLFPRVAKRQGQPVGGAEAGEPAPAIGFQGRNLLFSCYPVRLARELLELDTASMARKFGYSKQEWMRVEANLLLLSPALLADLEDFVRASLAEGCQG